MKIFVAGATGVIGRRLVPLLVEDGHDVVGMSRSEERARNLEDYGARGVVADVFDSERLRSRNARARQRQAPSLTLAQRIHQVGPNHRWQNAKFCLTDGE